MNNKHTQQSLLLLQELEEQTLDPARLQQLLLQDILRENLHTVYLRRCALPAVSENCFKECVPIVGYEDIKCDIEQIANGDKSPLLCAQPIGEFLMSSGTSSGVPKLYPKPADHLTRSQRFRNAASAVFHKHFPDLQKGKKLEFLYAREQAKTPCGLVAQTALTSYVLKLTSRSDFSDFSLSPREVLLCTDAAQSTYCQLLCGLARSLEVVNIGTFYASTLVRIIRTFEDCWADLCQDLESGQLNENVISDASVRKAMASVLQPDPQLAGRIRAECGKKKWQGILKRLWPNTRIIETVVTGSMQQYIPTIEYYSGGIHIVSMTYTSSETFLGINMNPMCSPGDITYMLAPEAAYFEFIPVDRNSDLLGEQGDSQKSLDLPAFVNLANVEVGKEYELVVTTYTGLYRYRIGDILRVEGYYNSAPTFSFICRQNVVLSIDTDKTDERDLHNAVTAAAASMHRTVRDYTSYANVESKPPHYVIFWELAEEENTEEGGRRRGNGNGEDDVEIVKEEEVEECCSVMEEKLSSRYRRGRREGAIGPLEIRLVAKGSFEKLMDSCVEGGGVNLGQVKVPRCLKGGTSLRLEVLERCVYQSAFSPRLPFYSLSQLLPNAHLSPQIAIPNNSK